MSETIYRIVQRIDESSGNIAQRFRQYKRVLLEGPGHYCHNQESKLRERENLHDVGIWTRSIVPAPTVVPGQVLLDRNPGALYSVHDSPIQF